jgi:hypothetical protein
VLEPCIGEFLSNPTWPGNSQCSGVAHLSTNPSPERSRSVEKRTLMQLCIDSKDFEEKGRFTFTNSVCNVERRERRTLL